MTAFAKWLISFICVFSLFWMYKGHKPEMTMVYPDSCTFTIDRDFSDDLQYQIKNFIDAAYKKNKNPSGLLQSLEAKFLQISSIVIDMHNQEAIHFQVQSRKPLFLVDAHVICADETIFDKQDFSDKALVNLHAISFQGTLNTKTIPFLVKLYEKMPDVILKDFSVRWLDQHAIWLDQKAGQQLSLLVDYESIPTQKDIDQCRHIRGQIVEKPCKTKKGKSCKEVVYWVCDLRFDHQIVLFSTK
jgi:hypothetical protein